MRRISGGNVRDGCQAGGGRSKRRFIDVVKKYMEEVGMTREDMVDRVRWR